MDHRVDSIVCLQLQELSATATQTEAGDAHTDQSQRTGLWGNNLEAVVGDGITAVGADARRASRVVAEESASVLHGAHPILVGTASDNHWIEDALAEVVQLSSGCCRGAAVV